MVQHELLMLVAAPLLALGRSFGAWLWALPPHWRIAIGNGCRKPLIRRPWQLLTHPLAAWLTRAAALWIWHAPQFFDAALRNNGIHALQQLSFVVSALFFWWAVLGKNRASRSLGLLYLFTTMPHTGALGALLTFSSTAWYAGYGVTGTYGLSPLEDQQLGELIMWVPGGLIYVAAALGLMVRHIGLSGMHAKKSAA